jgi:hypothetical protein
MVRDVLLITALALLILPATDCGISAGVRQPERETIRIGMSLEEFMKQHPDTVIPAGGTGQWTTGASVVGLPGQWSFTFEKSRLAWFVFDSYVNEIDKTHFDRCLAAARSIVREYTERLGKPYRSADGPQEFIDPLVKHHWGYKVLEAAWKTAGEKYLVRYVFFGGKGEYHFIVTIETQGSDYEF